MDKRYKIMLGMALSCISFTAWAGPCLLGQWCELKRPSDEVHIMIGTVYGNSYTCALSVDGEFDRRKLVEVGISGFGGFNMATTWLRAHQGGSSAVNFQGKFGNGHYAYLKVQRLVDDTASATNKSAQIRCFSAD